VSPLSTYYLTAEVPLEQPYFTDVFLSQSELKLNHWMSPFITVYPVSGQLPRMFSISIWDSILDYWILRPKLNKKKKDVDADFKGPFAEAGFEF
jgi:hypothetical protein